MDGFNADMLITRLNGTVFVRCLVAVAKGIGSLLPFRNRSSLFFFFPFMHIGGAERVHADIVSCFPQERPWVFFTKRSHNSKFRPLFASAARLFDIWPLLKYGYPTSVGIMAGLINRHKNPVVFGSNSLYYYLLVPYLKPHVRCIDLLHAFGGCSDTFSLPVADKLDCRVIINAKTKGDLEAQYRANGVDRRLLDRIVLIENRVTVPSQYPEKKHPDVLNVIFVGRGSPEKRVYLVGKIASRCREKRMPVQFILVGDVGEAVEPEDRKHCLLRGEISDAAVMSAIYDHAHILVLTSSREGFPLVVMEAMAHGVVPVCTDVGGIAAHVHHDANGLLVGNGGECEIEETFVAAIQRLSDERDTLQRMSRAAFEHARACFGSEQFCIAWRRLVLNKE